MAEPALSSDLEALDHFLLSDRAPPDSMGLSDLDGFLTGLVVGPETIMPSEWLPVIWGGESPVYDNLEEAQTILAAIMGRYNEIARGLDADPEVVAPVFLEDRDGSVIAESWAEGFMEAVTLRADTWSRMIRDRDARMLLAPILALASDADGNPLLPVDLVKDAEMLATVHDMIPPAIVAIRQFWREQNPFPAAPLRTGPKVGRNDPCPCGSGRKYKRCCGSN
jgi:uncharacterized protein